MSPGADIDIDMDIGIQMGRLALSVKNLSVRFGSTPVLTNLSFDVPEGTVLAVVGPNGAGKSVLARALVGTLGHAGSVEWAGGTRIGYVPQKLDLERDLPITGRDFLQAKAAVSRASGAEVGRAVARVGLTTASVGRSIGALSGGQFQRLLVAAALIGRPTVLLLDEPTAGVDEPGQDTINHTLAQLRETDGMTILFVSHDLSVVFRYATNVLCLSRHTTCFGPPRTILTTERLEEVYGAPVGYHVHERLPEGAAYNQQPDHAPDDAGR
jgi:zinc transport system ATP-binding protein